MDRLMIILIFYGALLNSVRSTTPNNTGILQYFSGALTSITCSTTTPSFLINGILTPQFYDMLPGMFGISAIVAPDRSNVTLLVEGTPMAHNVTVECQNIVDPVTGQKESIFHLTLLLADPIPAPSDVQYNGNDGVLRWSRPLIEEMLDNNNIINVALDLRITHYMIYVTDLSQQTGLLVTNFTTTGQETNIANVMSNATCSVSIQVSAVNPSGESQRSTSITENKCSPDLTTLSEIATTQEMDIESASSPSSVALSSGEIVAVVIVLVLVIVVVVCIALFTAVWVFTRNRKARNPTALKTTKSMAMHEDPEQKGQLRSSSEVSDASDSSQTKILTVTPSSSPMVTPKQPSNTQHQLQVLENTQNTNSSKETQLQCTQDGQHLVYAELAPPGVNAVSQPSSVEDTAYAVINHTDQTH